MEGALVFTSNMLVQSVHVAALVPAVIALQGLGLGWPGAGLLVGLVPVRGERGPTGERGPEGGDGRGGLGKGGGLGGGQGAARGLAFLYLPHVQDVALGREDHLVGQLEPLGEGEGGGRRGGTLEWRGGCLLHSSVGTGDRGDIRYGGWTSSQGAVGGQATQATGVGTVW